MSFFVLIIVSNAGTLESQNSISLYTQKKLFTQRDQHRRIARELLKMNFQIRLVYVVACTSFMVRRSYISIYMTVFFCLIVEWTNEQHFEYLKGREWISFGCEEKQCCGTCFVRKRYIVVYGVYFNEIIQSNKMIGELLDKNVQWCPDSE